MDEGAYLRHAIESFRAVRRRAERALAQTSDEAFFARLAPDTNDVATVVKHVAGNLRSRWTDFLTTDGEKPDRRRDAEFEREPGDTRASLVARWDAGWATLFATLEALAPSDLARTVTIRGEPHSVFEAIERQKEHYAYHAGQIVLLARHFAGPAWQSLSVPRGGSAAYEAATRSKFAPPPP
jgi:hypothetical protein